MPESPEPEVVTESSYDPALAAKLREDALTLLHDLIAQTHAVVGDIKMGALRSALNLALDAIDRCIRD